MNSELKQYFQSFFQYQSISKNNDILCKIDSTNTTFFSENLEKDSAFSPIFKKAKKIERETGINPLCKSWGLISILDSNGNSSKAPILLKEVKISSEADRFIVTEDGDYFLNPYLFYLLNIDQNVKIHSLDEFKKLDFSSNLELDESICLIGNFHPYRLEIYRDLSEIITINKVSGDLTKVLMMENDELQTVLDWKTKPILQLDHQQKIALEKLKSNSVVLHGPPGTGKSQLITNAIGSALNSHLSILMSSEKKASLDAVYKRLKKVGLHSFCLVNYSKNENKLIFRDLKKTWDFLCKERIYNPIQFDYKFPFLEEINELIQKQKLVQISIKEIVSKLEKSDALTIAEITNFEEFKESEDLLNSINENLFKLTNKLNFNQQWSEIKLFKVISECEKLLEYVSNYQAINTINDLDNLTRKLLIIQRFSSPLYEKYANLICNKPQKIKRLHAESIKIQKADLKWGGSLNHWINIPSKKELELLKELSVKKGIVDRIKFNFIWKKWVRSNQLDPISTCDEMMKHLVFQEAKNKFSLDLKELGIESILDLKLIYDLTINHSTENWNWFKNLKEDFKLNYKNAHSQLSFLKTIILEHFNFGKDDLISEFLNEFKRNKNCLLNELSIIENLPSSVREQLQKCSSIKEYYDQFYLSVWKVQFGRLEIPASLIQKEWVKSAIQYERRKSQVLKNNSIEIIEGIKRKFDAYHQLIETPNRKLTKDEQKLKSELKIGKSILIKEFGKVKQHMNFRKLYESEAKKWLLVIKPILMTHPLRIATYFPPEPEIFDLGIIDEASQMPFKNAIGTLQRVKRALIAGDEKQMDPSYFFTSNDNEHSVFHQAKYHFHNIELTHHYRCESEELISFSNRYFYDHKLQFIEQANFNLNQSVKHYFIENGLYHAGVNENEAQKVAEFIIKQLEKIGNETSLGIVAFSEAQLKSIIQKIPGKYATYIEELEDCNRLFFKTLDQVQGDECDVMIISFGYGKNGEGNFEMRFGPINQTGGEKRLNVLFSRAKKEINFFSSVRYHDFPETKNESVNLLKQWFALIEENMLKKPKLYEIHVLDILEQAKDAEDFTHLINIYNERGWTILTS